MVTWLLASSSVDQVANVVLYSNDCYVKCVALEESGWVLAPVLASVGELLNAWLCPPQGHCVPRSKPAEDLLSAASAGQQQRAAWHRPGRQAEARGHQPGLVQPVSEAPELVKEPSQDLTWTSSVSGSKQES